MGGYITVGVISPFPPEIARKYRWLYLTWLIGTPPYWSHRILIADYFLVRKTELNVDDLKRNGQYTFNDG